MDLLWALALSFGKCVLRSACLPLSDKLMKVVLTNMCRVMLGDITPVHIRSQAFALYMIVSYICNILIAVYTLSAIHFLGRGSDPEKNGIAKLYLIFRYVA